MARLLVTSALSPESWLLSMMLACGLKVAQTVATIEIASAKRVPNKSGTRTTARMGRTAMIGARLLDP
jgi:hypothetical protein